jgi:hypothetical protein
MPLKAAAIIMTILNSVGDISIANTDLYIVMMG